MPNSLHQQPQRSADDRQTLSTRMTILRYISDHGYATRETLATILHVTPQNISYHLRILEDTGFIQRNHGSRPQTWHLTDQGKTLFTFNIIREYITTIIPGLTSLTLLLLLITTPLITDTNVQSPYTFILIGGIITSLTIVILNIISKKLIHRQKK